MADGHGHDGIERPSLAAHVQTYGGVISLLKWGTVAAALVAALVIFLISR